MLLPPVVLLRLRAVGERAVGVLDLGGQGGPEAVGGAADVGQRLLRGGHVLADVLEAGQQVEQVPDGGPRAADVDRGVRAGRRGGQDGQLPDDRRGPGSSPGGPRRPRSSWRCPRGPNCCRAARGRRPRSGRRRARRAHRGCGGPPRARRGTPACWAVAAGAWPRRSGPAGCPDMILTRTSPDFRVALPGAGRLPTCSTQSPVACAQPATARATLSSQSFPIAAEVLVCGGLAGLLGLDECAQRRRGRRRAHAGCCPS